jgi:hypothetical protein
MVDLYEIRLIRVLYIMSYSRACYARKVLQTRKHAVTLSFLFLYIIGNMIKASTFHLTFICFVI